MRDIGRHIRSAERKSSSLFGRLEHPEEKLRKPKAKVEERKQYAELLAEWESGLERTEILDILFSWLREYVGFSGYGYAKSLSICRWILEEMTALSPGEENFLKAVLRFEKRLLSATPGEKAREAALSFPVDPRAFQLLYNQTAYRHTSQEYRFMEKKLFSFFGQRILEARDTLSSLLRSVFRASSLIENVNGRLRPFIVYS